MEENTPVVEQPQPSKGARGLRKIWRGALICLLILAVILAYKIYDRVSAPRLAEAEQAAVEFLDLPAAIEMYEQIAKRGSSWERGQAEMALALIDWNVYENTGAARDRLRRLIERNRNNAAPLIALARMEIGQQNFSAAREAALRAMEAAETGAESREAQVRFAWAVVE